LLTVSGVSNDIFLKSNSVKLLPIVSAEWNQNVFNHPYLTVAGDGTPVSIVKTSGTVTAVTDSNKHPYFDTFSFQMTGSNDQVLYTATPSSQTLSKAYKIVTYVTTASNTPIMVNAYAKGSVSRQFGSNNVEANSYNWTKLELYVGANDTISSFTLQLIFNKFSTSAENPLVYYTKPEVYATTSFDYTYGSVWSTETAFAGFRPGESYVRTGNNNFVFPDDFRRVKTASLLKSYTTNPFYMPVSPVVSTPSFFHSSAPLPIYKHGLMTDISSYRYFISDNVDTPSITGFYQTPIAMNKVVVKLNSYLSVPGIKVTVTKSDGSQIISDSILPDDNGMVILYLNNNTLTKDKWSTMPGFTSSGDVTNYVYIKSITVTGLVANARATVFNTSNANVLNDMGLLNVVEVSPRLEVDLTPYLIDVATNKSLDSKDTYLPISTVVTDDATITLSGIPLGDITNPVPIFSSVSNISSSVLKDIMRKNVKFYVNYNLVDYIDSSYVDQQVNKIIPGGVWYSDTWQQNDIDTVVVQCYDITRYLQSTPVTDYVANFKDAFEVITNILDLTGFTDYDIDSLYSVCYDLNTPLNMDYYFCNSKSSTLIEALNQIFLPYQIGAYIDNYGVMKFLSLSNILKLQQSSTNFDLDQNIVLQNGYTINNKSKPGKISLRYQTPKLKQSLSLQNVTNADIKIGPSYIYTTSNDVVWSQQSVDSVGLNYLASNMAVADSSFSINQADLLDSFHTFNLNNDGYAVIEDEIVSFIYKEYTISQSSNGSVSTTVSVKNDLELAAAVSKFIKDNEIGLIPNVGVIDSATPSTATVKGNTQKTTVYHVSSTATTEVPHPSSSFTVGSLVSVTGMSPESLNMSGQVIATGINSFTLVTGSADSMTAGWTKGRVSKGQDYDVKITPTGKITNINRGLFGTNVSDHKIISDLASKGLSASTVNSSYGIAAQSGNYSIVTTQTDPNNSAVQLPYYYVQANPDINSKVIFYPTSDVDLNYNTYSVKFGLNGTSNLCSGGLFFNATSSSTEGAYFVELVQSDIGTSPNHNYVYGLIVYKIVSGASSIVAYSNVSGTVYNILSNFEKLYKKNASASKADGSDAYTLYSDPHEAFHLRCTLVPFDNASDGEGPVGQSTYDANGALTGNGFALSVFLNNFEIQGWQVKSGNDWVSTDKNSITNLRKKIIVAPTRNTNAKFGAFFSANPPALTGTNDNVPYPASNNFTTKGNVGYLREIYASQKTLKERSVNYYFQDREFLNAMIQGQRTFSLYKEYIMQTQPEIIGINTYDVQYTNGAAVSVDILPVEYAWFYYPGNTLLEQQFLQHQIVDEYSAAYSTPINTGFRAKFAVANNSTHMVYLKKDSDELNAFVVNLNLWTHEIVVPSDPEIIEVVTDQGNVGEVVQLDSSFIQSRDAAGKLLKVVAAGVDNFSKDVTLSIFGNPLIEVGDVIGLTYPLMGINAQKYIVHSVSNNYNNGLTTKLTLNMLNRGINK
jgi:hypothetical protein